MYFAIEGIDTAGKTTQISRLKEIFKDAIITKEPGGTEFGKDVRQIALSAKAKSKKAEFLLFLSDRAEHILEIIKPNIHKNIISDRSAISGVAYALVQGEIDEKSLVELNNFATDCIYPQKVFLLRLTKEELEFRLSTKKLDGIEQRGSQYLLNIQDAMVKAAQLLGITLIEIDATQNIDKITNDILNNLKENND